MALLICLKNWQKSLMVNDFCVFILTNGRADNVSTYSLLKKQGYTGKIVLIVDNTDPQQDRYKELYGDEVYVFDKEKYFKQTDNMDNQGKMKSIVFARNASYDIAKELGFTYFTQFDDDYTQIYLKFHPKTFVYKSSMPMNLDKVFNRMLEFYKSTNIATLAMAQGGDFIGGGNSTNPLANAIILRRKAMNTFFCSTERPIKFIGYMNDDVNTYTLLGSRGNLFLTTSQLSVIQSQTQSLKGGTTEEYVEAGTYTKSFYTVMACPSFVKVSSMGPTNRRVHHSIKWKHGVPKILRQDHKK